MNSTLCIQRSIHLTPHASYLFPFCTFSNIRIGAQTVQPPPFVDHFPYLEMRKANWTAGTTVSIGQMAFQTEKQTICAEQRSVRVCESV